MSSLPAEPRQQQNGSSESESDGGNDDDLLSSGSSDEATAAAQPTQATVSVTPADEGSEAEIEAECAHFSVRYDPPSEAEKRDMAGQNPGRGKKALQKRRKLMAKQCSKAATQLSTTRDAARELRRAAAAAASLPAAVVAPTAASSETDELQRSFATTSLAATTAGPRAYSWRYEGQLSDELLAEVWQIWQRWQLDRAAPRCPHLQRLAFLPPSIVFVVLEQKASADQLCRQLFRADWQQARFDPKAWAELAERCGAGGGFVLCKSAEQAANEPVAPDPMDAIWDRPGGSRLCLMTCGVENKGWTTVDLSNDTRVWNKVWNRPHLPGLTRKHLFTWRPELIFDVKRVVTGGDHCIEDIQIVECKPAVSESEHLAA